VGALDGGAGDAAALGGATGAEIVGCEPDAGTDGVAAAVVAEVAVAAEPPDEQAAVAAASTAVPDAARTARRGNGRGVSDTGRILRSTSVGRLGIR